jgi:RNase P/RNase MRP subunit p29
MQYSSNTVVIAGIAGIVILETVNCLTIRVDGQLFTACISAIVCLITRTHYRKKPLGNLSGSV